MDKLVNRFSKYCNGATVLFGDGANGGLFTKLRGGGIKGPVLELQKRLAEKLKVIKCDVSNI